MVEGVASCALYGVISSGPASPAWRSVPLARASSTDCRTSARVTGVPGASSARTAPAAMVSTVSARSCLAFMMDSLMKKISIRLDSGCATLRSHRRPSSDISRARRIARVLDPPTAQIAVEIDQAGEARQARRHQRELRAVQAGLRRQHREVARDAVLELQLRQIQGALLGLGDALERRDLVAVGAACREAVGHF